MSKRIWIVSELYYPEETSTGYFLTKIAEGLARYYSVHVLCGQPSYSSRGLRTPDREEHNRVNIQRCLSTTFSKDALPLRLINLSTLSLSIFIKAVWQFSSQDCILVVTNPPSLPFPIAVACRLRRSKCLLLIHDVYPEVLIAAGMIEQGAILTRFFGWLNQRLYRSVDRIIVLGRDMKRVIARKLDNGFNGITIIPNWADLKQILPSERTQNPLINKLGLREKFVVQFSGNMGRTHGLECLVESAKRLSDRPEIHFLFLGWGAKQRWLQEAVQKNRLSNVTVLPNQPRSELSNSLNATDVAIISFLPGMAGLSVPSRMYNILAAGKPIIAVADSDSELALVTQEERIGWVVPPGQTDKVVEAILDAQSHPDQLLEMGVRARLVAETKYSFQKVIESYLASINAISDSVY